MSEETNVYCRKCNAKVPNGKQCINCKCYVDSYDLTTSMRCPDCHAQMTESICRKCGYDMSTKSKYNFSENPNTERCEKCGSFLIDGECLSCRPSFTVRIMNAFYNLPFVWKNTIIIICLIAFFILGFALKHATGVKKNEYVSLQNNYQTLKDENAKISNEYNSYKAKMQPYEDVQLADAKNKAEKEALENAEKKAAEEKAAAEAKAKQEAESKAAAEAKAAEEAKGYETGITFDNLARTPDEYKGKKVKFKGKVIQVIEGTTETQLRLAIDGNYDKIIFCRVPKEKTASMRILEDDYIHVMGISNGLISYQSTIGGNITIPDVSVQEWGY